MTTKNNWVEYAERLEREDRRHRLVNAAVSFVASLAVGLVIGLVLVRWYFMASGR